MRLSDYFVPDLNYLAKVYNFQTFLTNNMLRGRALESDYFLIRNNNNIVTEYRKHNFFKERNI